MHTIYNSIYALRSSFYISYNCAWNLSKLCCWRRKAIQSFWKNSANMLRVCWKLFSVPQDAGVAAVRSIENGSQLRELYKLSLPRCRNASTENNGLIPGSSHPFFPSSLPPSAQTEFYPWSRSSHTSSRRRIMQRAIPIYFPFPSNRSENVLVEQYEQREKYYCFTRPVFAR